MPLYTYLDRGDLARSSIAVTTIPYGDRRRDVRRSPRSTRMMSVDEMTATTDDGSRGDPRCILHARLHPDPYRPIVTPSRFLLFVLRASSNTGDALNK